MYSLYSSIALGVTKYRYVCSKTVSRVKGVLSKQKITASRKMITEKWLLINNTDQPL